MATHRGSPFGFLSWLAFTVLLASVRASAMAESGAVQFDDAMIGPSYSQELGVMLAVVAVLIGPWFAMRRLAITASRHPRWARFYRLVPAVAGLPWLASLWWMDLSPESLPYGLWVFYYLLGAHFALTALPGMPLVMAGLALLDIVQGSAPSESRPEFLVAVLSAISVWAGWYVVCQLFGEWAKRRLQRGETGASTLIGLHLAESQKPDP